MVNEIMPITKIAVFRSKKIRKIIRNDEWWFSVVDVCRALTDSIDAGAYWRKLKQRLKEEGSEVVTFCHGLKLEASDGKKYETDCANTEGIFRIIQLSHRPKQSRLRDGWHGLVMSGCRRLTARSWQQKEHGLYIKPKGISMTG